MNVIIQHQQTAAECLVKRQFEQAEQICKKQLKELKKEQDQESYMETTEQLIVVLIQSLAEMDRWQDVLPVINDVYGSIENVPPNILKYCMLLHSKVQEFTTCTTLYHVWIRATDGRDKAAQDGDLRMLADVYVRKVLIPQEKYDHIDKFLETTSLSDEEKQHLMGRYQQIAQKTSNPSTPNIEGTTPTYSTATTEEKFVTEDPQSLLDNMVAKTLRALSAVLRYLQSCKIRLRHVIPWVTGLLTVYLLLFTNLDSSSNIKRLSSTVWSQANRLVSLLFP